MSQPPPHDSDAQQQDELANAPNFKPPSWAFAINFFWPGAGLVYLGKPLWGLLNFIVVVAIAAAVWIALPNAEREKWTPWIGLLLSGGSGFLAHQIANQVNERLAEEFQSAANSHEKPGG